MIEARGSDSAHAASGMELLDEPGRSLVRAWGEIDLEVRRTASQLCGEVADRGLPVVIDARDVTFIDSAGMSVLVRMARDAETRGYQVSLRNAPWMLTELLSVTGVDQLLGTADPEPAPTDEPRPSA